MKGPSFRTVRQHLNAIGVRIKRTGWDRELRVYFPGSAPDEGHFTDDLDDALNTGRAMAAWRAKQEEKPPIGPIGSEGI